MFTAACLPEHSATVILHVNINNDYTVDRINHIN